MRDTVVLKHDSLHWSFAYGPEQALPYSEHLFNILLSMVLHHIFSNAIMTVL